MSLFVTWLAGQRKTRYIHHYIDILGHVRLRWYSNRFWKHFKIFLFLNFFSLYFFSYVCYLQSLRTAYIHNSTLHLLIVLNHDSLFFYPAILNISTLCSFVEVSFWTYALFIHRYVIFWMIAFSDYLAVCEKHFV